MGFDPLEKTEPSGRSVAAEWYILSTVLSTMTSEKREPIGALAS